MAQHVLQQQPENMDTSMIITVGLAALFVWLAFKVAKWALKTEEKTTDTKPSGTETEVEKKAREAATKKAAANKEKGFLATCGRGLKWVTIRAIWLALIVGLGYGLFWFIDHHKWSNGRTILQMATPLDGGATAAPSQKKAKWICMLNGTERIQQNAVITADERGISPRLVVEVSYRDGNRSDSRQIVRYSWNGGTEIGTWFDEGTGQQGTFTGRYDYTANSATGAIFFEGIKTELDGSKNPFRFERSN